MTVAVIQLNAQDDLRLNLQQTTLQLTKAADAGATVMVLPENFAFMGAREGDKLIHAEDDGSGIIQDFIADIAQRLKIWVIAGTLPIKSGDGRVFAASCVYADNGQRVARYDKIHLFDVDLPNGERYRESNSIAPGAIKPTVLSTPIGCLGLTVCYDLRFSPFFKTLTDLGATVITVPAAFTAKTGAAHWHTLLKARAIENQCFILAAGQVGSHPGGRTTYGHSIIISPWGEVLAECDGQSSGFVHAALDLLELQNLRDTFPVLKHHRF